MDNDNKLMRSFGILAVGAVLSSAAMGYTINGGAIDVGALDTFLSETQLPNSGQQTETDWVNGLVDPDTVFNTKTEDVEYFLVDGETSIYAFSLQAAPEYFLIKNAQNTALFVNNGSHDWGVFDLSLLELSRWNLGNGDTISHVTEFGSAPTTVPEPTGMVLLGLGLMGIAAARRINGKA